MIKRIKRIIATATLGAMTLLPVLPVAMVGAQSADCLDNAGGTIAGCLGSGANSTDPDAVGGSATDKVDATVRLIINVFSWVVGIASVIMIIVGGFKYIISGGDSGNITGAKNTILYAIIGLVIVALAQVIVQFVLEKATA